MSNMGKIVKSLVLVVLVCCLLGGMQKMADRYYSQVNRDVAVATLNGGNAEFANQQVAQTAGNSINWIFMLAYLATIGIGLKSAWKPFCILFNGEPEVGNTGADTGDVGPRCKCGPACECGKK